MGKRLFVAVDIDAATRDEISLLSSELQRRVGGDVKASWVKPDRMHLTLHFFGTVEHVAEQQICAALTVLAEPAFDVSFDGLGIFPARGSPRVLWLGVRDGRSNLQQLHQTLERRLQRPHEVYSPHLTLARIRNPVKRASIEKALSTPAGAGPSRIDRVTLYESRLSPAGPTYVALAEAPLRP